jgi:hypothetical protein
MDRTLIIISGHKKEEEKDADCIIWKFFVKMRQPRKLKGGNTIYNKLKREVTGT